MQEQAQDIYHTAASQVSVLIFATSGKVFHENLQTKDITQFNCDYPPVSLRLSHVADDAWREQRGEE